MMRQKTNPAKHRKQKTLSANQKLPFIEHLYELRRRLVYIALSIGLWAAAAYAVQQKIVGILLAPSHNQQFIYTSVGGGIDFLFRVCIYAGVTFSIPVIVFQLLRYLAPLIKEDARRFVAWGSVVSGFLAFAGMLFGYFVGLPAALHFLLHQFTTSQIHPLLTIQSYMSFVSLYMFGSALLFQLPLIIIVINRIKPLRPQRLFHYERWVILLAFVGGGLMNPSPRLQDQLLLSGPVIITYQLAILLVWLLNRRKQRSPGLTKLLEQDAKLRAERLARFNAAVAAARASRASLPQAAPVVNRAAVPVSKKLAAAPAPAPLPSPASISPAPAQRPSSPSRPLRYLNDFTGRRATFSRTTQ
ncbi:MAG TPA: twin-arginine translocase subunit TatC [Candidatus Saccharimonadales bacterium]|nr:twin-arginine translocase subunit TatC [Candidatus Saccharimonadales bacterium]